MTADPAMGPAFDPRFDPRFQRGYSGDGGAGVDGDPGPDIAAGARGSAGPARPTGVVPISEPDAEATPAQPQERAVIEVPATEPSSPAVAATSAHGPAASESSEPMTIADLLGADGTVDVADVETLPGPDSTDRRRERNEELARLWMRAAWAVALACIVVGFGLFWAANDAASYSYVGIPTAEQQLLQALGWWLAPPLVEGGIIGVVSLLVIGGIRRAQHAGRRGDRG
jgi:hypothetical protein